MENVVGCQGRFRGWVVFSALALASIVLHPAAARGDCPPTAPYNPEVQALIDSCQNWVCDVVYNPADGYLPENHPEFPWEASYEPGTTAQIVDDKLVVIGPGAPTPLPEAAMYIRHEDAMEDPGTWLYLIQGRYRVTKLFTNTNTQDETLAIMGASDPDRGAVFSLRYQDGERVVVTGEPDYCGTPEYVFPWNWEIDTTYTYVVHRGVQTYLFVDDQPVMTRPYEDLDPDPPTLPGVFAFTSGDAEAEYSWVRYCACSTEAPEDRDGDGIPDRYDFDPDHKWVGYDLDQDGVSDMYLSGGTKQDCDAECGVLYAGDQAQIDECVNSTCRMDNCMDMTETACASIKTCVDNNEAGCFSAWSCWLSYSNPEQLDQDGDGIGDLCEAEIPPTAELHCGRQADRAEESPSLEGPEEKIVVRDIRAEQDPEAPGTQESQLDLDLDVLELPGIRSGKFDFHAKITWQIMALAGCRPVRTITEEFVLDETGTHPLTLFWDGKDGEGEDLAVSAYMFKVKLQLIRTKIKDGKTKVFDEVASQWRFISSPAKIRYLALKDISAASAEAWRSGAYLTPEQKALVSESIAPTTNPMQYYRPIKNFVPTFVGGPGFAVGNFNLDREPLQLADDVLSAWDYLSITDTFTELETLRVTIKKNTRSLKFRQLIDGVPVYQNRLSFIFTNSGQFINYSGKYLPHDCQVYPPFSSTCSQLIGQLDDQGNEITECQEYYYVPDDFIAFPGYTLIPVYALVSTDVTGARFSSILSDLDQNFYRRTWRSRSPTDRRIYSNYPDGWEKIYENEVCEFPLGHEFCQDEDYFRIQRDLIWYAGWMDQYHNRTSWDPANNRDYEVRVDRNLDPVADPFCPKWDGMKAYLPKDSRLTRLVHEFTHGVVNVEAPGTEAGLAHGLADVQAIVMTEDTDHWCYHNYPSPLDPLDRDWLEPCVDSVHMERGRCHMLAGDTVAEVPERNLARREPKEVGLLYNIYDAELGQKTEYLNSTVYGKVFNLMQHGFWPNYMFNAFEISKEIPFWKADELFYEFVTDQLQGVSSEPWKDYGPRFLEVAWIAYMNEVLSPVEFTETCKALYAVGFRQAPLDVDGHRGTNLRQAAFYKDGVIYLFYADFGGYIYYQKRVAGWWEPPVLVTRESRAKYGLDAFLLPSGEAYVVFTDVYYRLNYIKIFDSGVVDSVAVPLPWLTSHLYWPQPVCMELAASGVGVAAVYDGNDIWVHSLAVRNGSVQWQMARVRDCQIFDVTTAVGTGGWPMAWSLATYQGDIYAITLDWDPYIRYLGVEDGANTFVTRWDPQMSLFGTIGEGDVFLDVSYISCYYYGQYWSDSEPRDKLYGCFPPHAERAYRPLSSPNLYAVAMPQGRKEFERFYAGFAHSKKEFMITRFAIEPAGDRYWTNRTRILPVDSGDPNDVSPPEFLQTREYLFIFEGPKMHVIKLWQ